VNLAHGFACPACGNRSADLLAIDKDAGGWIRALRLHCTRCEWVFTESARRAEPATAAPHLPVTRPARQRNAR
jgi:hypothetical protein